MNNNRTVQALSWLCAIFLAAASICIAWILFDGPNISFATNSDTLLPSAWAQIVFHEHYPAGSFQLPQTTSLFPDLALHTTLQLATGSWRMATLIFGWLQLVALIAAAGLIVRQITGAPRLLGAAIFTLLVIALLAVDMVEGRPNVTRTRIVVEIVAHGGAFLLTLFGAALVCRMLTNGVSRMQSGLLFLLAGIAYFSDQLTTFEFVVPVFAALICVRHEMDWREAAKGILAPIVLGVVVAHLGLQFISSQHVGLGHPHLTQLLRDSAGAVAVLWYLPALIFALLLFPKRILREAAPCVATLAGRFHWTFGMVASLSTFVATVMVVYSDDGGFRYFYALAWWPAILAAALIAAPLSSRRYAAVAASGLALLVLLPQIPRHRPAILGWTSPVADCLLAHRQQEGLDAGLGPYWAARQTEASSDWSIPMAQTVSDGAPYRWGNDRQRERDNAGRYNFIVMKDLDQTQIRARYGAPRKVLECPGTAVWLYPHGGLAGGFTR